MELKVQFYFEIKAVIKFFLVFIFHLYIYPPDSLECDGSAKHKIIPTCFQRCQDIAVWLKFFISNFILFLKG